MRTLISYLHSIFVSVAALWSYSLPNADELDALDEMSNRAVVQEDNCRSYPLIRHCSPGFKRREFGPPG